MTLRSDNQPWYKHRWPWILIAGPATVVVAGVIAYALWFVLMIAATGALGGIYQTALYHYAADGVPPPSRLRTTCGSVRMAR